MMIISIIAILGIVILSTSLVTYRMKETYLKSQKTFYSAESVVDAIRVGLQQDVAASAGAAYSWVLERYGDSDETERKEQYLERFDNNLLGRISGGFGGLSRVYSIDHLNSLVPAAVTASALNNSSASTPIVAAWGGTPYLNHDPDKGTYTLKNLWVRYVDENNYLTEIRTDIVISSPKIDFSQKSSEPMDLTNYAFVACTQTEATSAAELTVTGNAYLGDVGTDFSLSTVNFKPTTANSGGKLITGGTLMARNNATVNIENGYSIWAHELLADAAGVNVDGVLYLNDDLVLENSIGTSVNVNLNGRLYAYGNPSSAETADAFLWDASALSDLLAHPANYSSAILINGRNATLDMGGLEDMILAGNAYVAAGKEDSSNSDVQMGESLALKASQRAYLVPSQFFARYCVNGGMNPMTESVYNELQEEIRGIFGYGSVSDIQDLDYLRGSEDEELAIPEELARYHVTGIQREYYRVLTRNGSITMVYFFLKFQTEADVVNFANSYYAKDKNLSALKERVDSSHYNTVVTYPGGMRPEFESPENLISDYTFYYNGSVLVPDDANTKFVGGQCTKLSSLAATSLAAKAREYQNTFSALRHCLLSDFTLMTAEQRNRSIYQNLVRDMNGFTGEDAGKNIASGVKKLFSTGTSGIAADSQMCALVVNGNYTLTGSGDDAYETVNSESLPVHLVIASGDVTVDCNYRGLIIAGGKVSFTSRCRNISADSNLAQQALKIPHADASCPVDYLVNGQNYLVDANGSGMGGDMIDYADHVVYRNWVKQ